MLIICYVSVLCQIMAKFKIGDCVKFRGKEFELPSVDGLSVKLNTDKFIGKVTGSIDCGPKGTEYFVDVNVHGITWNVKVSEDQIMSLMDYVVDLVEEFAKSLRSNFSVRTSNALNLLCEELRKGPEIRSFVLPTFNPEYNSWFKDLLEKSKGERTNTLNDLVLERFSDGLRKIPGYEYVLLHRGNIDRCKDFKPFWPVSDDLIKKYEERLHELGKRFFVGADAGSDEHKTEQKMTKQRCIKLLESYRAEREKVAKGRKFERCLREGVVNEALERAIELLKSEK